MHFICQNQSSRNSASCHPNRRYGNCRLYFQAPWAPKTLSAEHAHVLVFGPCSFEERGQRVFLEHHRIGFIKNSENYSFSEMGPREAEVVMLVLLLLCKLAQAQSICCRRHQFPLLSERAVCRDFLSQKELFFHFLSFHLSFHTIHHYHSKNPNILSTD